VSKTLCRRWRGHFFKFTLWDNMDAVQLSRRTDSL